MKVTDVWKTYHDEECSMKVGEILRVEYDDDVISVIDKVNEALKDHDLKFEDDNLEHDGFNLLMLKRIGQDSDFEKGYDQGVVEVMGEVQKLADPVFAVLCDTPAWSKAWKKAHNS
jgi:hypothetical protein